jgi:hypothetical protein
MRFGSILGGVGVLAALLAMPNVGTVTNYGDDEGPKKSPKFGLKDPSGPVTDSTPLTKREKRKLRRK